MSTVSKTSYIDFDEFCMLVKDGEKADLIDGVIYMASPDNTRANRINLWLGSMIEWFAGKFDLGEPFVSRVAFRLDDKNGADPDIGFVCKNRLHLVKKGRVDGPPDLAIEIVSPESVDRDYGKKRDQYERYGVREYWIIDELDETITLFFQKKDGTFREVRPKKGAYHSRVLPGFCIRPEWCWQRPLPAAIKIVRTMIDEYKKTTN